MAETSSRSEGFVGASVDKLRREFDDLLESAWSQGGRTLSKLGAFVTRPFVPMVDIVESSEDVFVHIDLPGINPALVDITLAGNMLTVKAEKSPLVVASGETAHLTERSHGSFTRSIPMPVAVNPEAVSAESHHGVLVIRLQKSERAKARQIRVNVGG